VHAPSHTPPRAQFDINFCMTKETITGKFYIYFVFVLPFFLCCCVLFLKLHINCLDVSGWNVIMIGGNEGHEC